MNKRTFIKGLFGLALVPFALKAESINKQVAGTYVKISVDKNSRVTSLSAPTRDFKLDLDAIRQLKKAGYLTEKQLVSASELLDIPTYII
jgi:hypothetical protein